MKKREEFVTVEEFGKRIGAAVAAAHIREANRRKKISRAMRRRAEERRRTERRQRPRCKTCGRSPWYRVEVNGKANHYCRTHLLAIAIRALEARGWSVQEI